MDISYSALGVILLELKSEGKLLLETSTPSKITAFDYIINTNLNLDFWSIITSLALLTISILQPQLTPLAPLRWILGIPIVLILPGYTIQMSIFPRKRDIAQWQRVVLSLGLSLAVIGFYSTILDVTPQGIVLGSIFPLLSLHALIFTAIGMVRRFFAQGNISA